jgi:CHAT domain-containing protein
MQIFALEDLPRDRLQKLQVVVLAACPTAENDSARAQPDTLVRSFLRAGVPHVLAARWPVESSATSETMAEFYKRLLDGAPVALALQQASATLREQPRRSHPFYWAAFSAYGH